MEPLAARGRLATAILACLLAGPTLAQSIWVVDGSVPGPGEGTRADPYGSIQYALHAPTTQAGDTLLVLPGIYYENVCIDRFGVTLRALEGPALTVLHARGPGTTLLVRHDDLLNPTVIEGFSVVGGSGSDYELGSVGGGVFLDGTDASLVDCFVSANRAVLGAGVAVIGARLEARGLELYANVAEVGARDKDGHGGGLYLQRSPAATLEDCRVTHNSAGRGGGIYAEDSWLALERVHLEANVVSQGDFLDQCGEGGGLYVFGGHTGIRSSDFVGNLARGTGTRGGGARLVLTRATIRGGSFVGNVAGAFWPDTWRYPADGGGLASECELDVEGTLFEANRASNCGGAINGPGCFRACTLRGNSARQGGASWIETARAPAQPGTCFYAPLRFERCEFVDNLAQGPGEAQGGAVCGPAYLESCRLAGNGARGNGGAAAHASLVDCVLEDNTAASPDLLASTFGGGAYECDLERCTLRRNVSLGVGKAIGYGGGAYGGTAVRTIFAENQADFGGALAHGTMLPLEHLTLWGNRAVYGGGGVFFMSPGSLRNSVLWENSPDCIGGAVQRAVVTWSDVQGGCPGLGNTDVEPCFWAPEAGDFHLLPDSPCIDSGDPRGPPDPDGTRADRGAWPFDEDWCGSPQPICRAKPNSAGCLPSIHWRGTPSQGGPDDFVVGAVDVLGGQPGALMLSRHGAELPLVGGGMLCLARPIQLVAVATSGGNPSGLDCSGTFAFDLPQATLAAYGLTAGETAFVQIYYRDSGFVSPFDVGLTDALRFSVCP